MAGPRHGDVRCPIDTVIGMDVSALAGRAVELVANEMITAESPDGANREEVAGLWRLVAHRLGASELGGTLLGRLREQPDDQGRRAMASSALAQSAAGDPAFLAALHQAVHGTPVPRSTISHQANVSVGGANSGDIAGGSIDKSTHRKTRISTGGWIVAGLVALTVGGTTVVAATSGQTDPSEIGTERTEQGVREAAKGYLDAFSAKDADRTCAFIKSSKRRGSLAETCVEHLNNRVFNTISANWFDKMQDATVGEVEFFRNPSRADAYVMLGAEKVTTPLEFEYEGGRWFIDAHISSLVDLD